MLKNKLPILAVVLGVVLVAIVFLVNNKEEKFTVLPEIKTEKVAEWPKTKPVDPVKKLQEDQETLWIVLEEKQKTFQDRQTLMGILINNNFAAIKDGYEEDVVFLNGDWTINKMPTRLTLTDSDRKFLERFIKP